MSSCTFFGHRDCPLSICARLKFVLEKLIVDNAVDTFYVGNHGNFDRYVYQMLRELQQEHPQIHYQIVLAYLPGKASEHEKEKYEHTLFPEGLENVPRRFAIDYRNKWMLERAEYVVTYITRSFGGAAKYALLTEKKGKTQINLAFPENLL